MRALAALPVLVLASPAQAACRLALVLALDVSGSVDAREYRLQLDGVAAALLNDEVRASFFSPPDTTVEIAVFQWGAPWQQYMVLDWTTVTSPQVLDEIALKLRATNVTFKNPSTAIGSAMQYSLALLEQKPDCWTQTIDISGDGPANWGPDPDTIARGPRTRVTINGLVIGPTSRDNIGKNLSGVSNLLDYYQRRVIRGSQAFVETAVDFDDYERAMIRKLTRELQTLIVSDDQTGTATKGTEGTKPPG